MPTGKLTIAETFDQHWKLDPETGCHIWQRARKGKEAARGGGYPCLSVKGVSTGGHIFAFEKHHGRKVKKGMQIMHSCHNTLCVNPAHLSEGTNEQNQWDAAAAGLRAQKLTPEAIRDIRANCKVRGDQAKMCKKYGVASSEISCIISGKLWKHVT